MIKIYTYQMIGLADDNGRIYESKYGTYSKKNGLKLSELSKSMIKEELIDNLFHEDCWSLKKIPKKMTKGEIEKALGFEVEIIDEKPKTNNKATVNTNSYKNHLNEELSSIFQFWH